MKFPFEIRDMLIEGDGTNGFARDVSVHRHIPMSVYRNDVIYISKKVLQCMY